MPILSLAGQFHHTKLEVDLSREQIIHFAAWLFFVRYYFWCLKTYRFAIFPVSLCLRQTWKLFLKLCLRRWFRSRRNPVVSFDSFEIMAVKNTVWFGSYKLWNIIVEKINALRVSYILIQVILFMNSRRKERIFEKLMFYPKLRNNFWVSHHLLPMVWWGNYAKK